MGSNYLEILMASETTYIADLSKAEKLKLYGLGCSLKPMQKGHWFQLKKFGLATAENAFEITFFAFPVLYRVHRGSKGKTTTASLPF